MVIDESLSNIERTVAHLQANTPDYKASPAVVAAPQWWVDLLKNLHKESMVDATDEVDQVCGCKLIVKPELEEPFTISGEGRLFPVLPAWARVANKGGVI